MHKTYIAIAAALFLSLPTPAALIWDGAAAKGPSVFKNLEEHEGSITVVDDPQRGKVWRCHKPQNSNRCETRGAAGWDPKIGETVFIGWRSKLEVPQGATINASYQWKSYGRPMLQNYPLVLKTRGGDFYFEQYNPNPNPGNYNVRTDVWRTRFVPNQWMTHVIGIRISDKVTEGHIEWWYNGEAQELLPGGKRFVCRTFDGTSVEPKFGIYGGSSAAMTNLVSDLRIATTYAEAAPEQPIAIRLEAGKTLRLRREGAAGYDAAGRLLDISGVSAGAARVLFSAPLR